MKKTVNISGSRAAAILGVSKYRTPLNVWAEIMESRQPGFCKKNNYTYIPFEGNESTRYGLAFESAIIDIAKRKIGKDISSREKYFKKDYLSCHVDGIIENSILYEAKTTSIHSYKSEWGEPGTDRIPIEYQLQICHNLILTGLKKAFVFVLVFPKRPDDWKELEVDIDNINCYEWANTLSDMKFFHQYEIKADPDLQAVMIEYYTDFWENHVLTGVSPRPEGYPDIKLLVREPAGTIIASDYITSLSREYKDIQKEISKTGDLAKRAAWCKVKILDYMRGAEKTLDDDSEKKWILVDNAGGKLNQYNGKAFR